MDHLFHEYQKIYKKTRLSTDEPTDLWTMTWMYIFLSSFELCSKWTCHCTVSAEIKTESIKKKYYLQLFTTLEDIHVSFQFPDVSLKKKTLTSKCLFCLMWSSYLICMQTFCCTVLAFIFLFFIHQILYFFSLYKDFICGKTHVLMWTYIEA